MTKDEKRVIEAETERIAARDWERTAAIGAANDAVTDYNECWGII